MVVAATAGVSRPVAEAADLRTAGQKIAHGQQPSGVTLDKNERTPFKTYNGHQ